MTDQVYPGEDLQRAVEVRAEAGGGALVLQPGATYEGVALNLGAGSSYTRVIGQRATLVGRLGQHLLTIGAESAGYPKLKGIEFVDCDFVIPGFGIIAGNVDGLTFDNCRFYDSPFEAVKTHGAGSAVNAKMRNCHAFHCGLGFSAPRSAFNLNCVDGVLEYCTASDCGLFAELGGAGTRVRHCVMDRSPVKIGSGGFGCSDVELSHCTLTRSTVDCCNPIGRMADIRLINSHCIDSPFVWSGELDHNLHAVPSEWPFSDRPALVANNTFLGRGALHEAQALVLNPYTPGLRSSALVFARNYVDCPDGYAVTIQGPIAAPVRFEANDWAQKHVGQMHLNGPYGPYHDGSALLEFVRNRGPVGAFINKHPKRLAVVL